MFLLPFDCKAQFQLCCRSAAPHGARRRSPLHPHSATQSTGQPRWRTWPQHHTPALKRAGSSGASRPAKRVDCQMAGYTAEGAAKRAGCLPVKTVNHGWRGQINGW